MRINSESIFELEYLEKPYYFSDRNIHFKIGATDYIYIDRYNNTRDIGYNVTLEKIEGQELKEKLQPKESNGTLQQINGV